jgi:hypothetical protein
MSPIAKVSAVIVLGPCRLGGLAVNYHVPDGEMHGKWREVAASGPHSAGRSGNKRELGRPGGSLQPFGGRNPGRTARRAVKWSHSHAEIKSVDLRLAALEGDGMTLFKSRDTSELETSVETEVEGEIREFVRRDVATLRRHAENDSEIVASNINSLLQRVAGTSIQEIDKLIAELQTLRDRLTTEAARVQREIVEYATLSQAAMQSTKIIAESISSWKNLPDVSSIRD